MTTLAPPAMRAGFDRFQARVPTAKLGGIVGDAAHGRSGYHISRQDCYANDYSVVMADDKLGSSTYASALDITLSPSQMRTFSARLMALCKANDPRVYGLREWFGTINGVSVTGWDRHGRNNVDDDTYTSSDPSHLWHIHLSFYRLFSNDTAAIFSVIDAMTGTSGDIVTDAEISAIANAVFAKLLNTDGVLDSPDAETSTNKFWAWKSHIVGTTKASRLAASLAGSILPRVVANQADTAAARVDTAACRADVAALRAEVKAAVSGAVHVTPSTVPVTGTLTVGAVAK